MITELILNTTLLIALAVLFSFISRGSETESIRQQLLSGFIFGAIAVIGMSIPFKISQGIIYDGRSVVLSMAGLFGGYITGILSLFMALFYRIYLGGSGVYAGAATIILSVSVGLLFRKLNKNKPEQITILQLYLLGLASSAGMIACQVLLPKSKAFDVIDIIWLPVISIFPMAELLMGIIFRNDKRRIRAEAEVKENELRYRTTLMSIGDGIITTDTEGYIRFMNPVAAQLTGWEPEAATGKKISDILIIKNELTGETLSCPVEKILTEGNAKSLTNHTLLITRDGKQIPISDSGAPIRDSKGNVSGAVLVFRDHSEERKLKNQLVESERLFHTLTEKSPVGIFRTLSNGYTTFVNPKYCEISGLNKDEALGHGWLKAIHPEDQDILKQGWQVASQKQNSSTTEYRFLRSNGQITWVMGVAVPEFNVNGELLGYIGTIIDITERKIAEKEFTQSHENFKRTMDDSPLGIRIVSNDGLTSYANTSFLALYEYENENEFEMAPASSRYTPESLKLHEQRKQLRKQGLETPQQYEIDIVTKKGSIRNLLVIRKLVYWDGQDQDLIIYQDFTERKKMENSLQLFEHAIVQSPASTVITDNQGKIIYANPKFTETSGYSSDEVAGKTPSFLKSGFHSDEFYKGLWSTILSGKEWRGEFLNKNKNGRQYWESAVISSIVNEKGKITHFIGVKEDITEKKKIISDLQQAKEKAEESDRLKSAFLANMSHEIRTPLNAIMGFTNLLIDNNDLDEDSKIEFSSIIYQSSENLLQVINDILDISKIETGQLQMFPSKFAVQPVMQELYTIACHQRKKLDKDHIPINYMLNSDEFNLYTDKVRFAQIFNNLINNALKFTEQGEISFGISELSDSKVTFFVSDTGIGIKKSLQDHIFERFRQADESPTRTHGGAGLGLSISKKLVEQMGGEISLMSEQGKGTTFKFTMPVSGETWLS